MTDRRALRESGHGSPAGPAQQLPILMYHEIAAEPVGTARLAVRPDDFARQLECLAEAGYTTVHAADVAAAMAGACLASGPGCRPDVR